MRPFMTPYAGLPSDPDIKCLNCGHIALMHFHYTTRTTLCSNRTVNYRSVYEVNDVVCPCREFVKPVGKLGGILHNRAVTLRLRGMR